MIRKAVPSEYWYGHWQHPPSTGPSLLNSHFGAAIEKCCVLLPDKETDGRVRRWSVPIVAKLMMMLGVWVDKGSRNSQNNPIV